MQILTNKWLVEEEVNTYSREFQAVFSVKIKVKSLAESDGEGGRAGA